MTDWLSLLVFEEWVGEEEEEEEEVWAYVVTTSHLSC